MRLSIDDNASEINIPGVSWPGSVFPDPTDARRLEFQRVDLSPPAPVQALQVSWLGDGPVTLRSTTLIGPSSNEDRSVPVDRRLVLSYLGDMKIYDIT